MDTGRIVCTDKMSRVAFTTVIADAFVCVVFGNMTKLLAVKAANYRFDAFYLDNGVVYLVC